MESGIEPEAICRRAAQGALAAAASAGGELEVSVMLSDDVTVARLNQDYRATEGPTNVLSFANFTGESGSVSGPPVLLGDVVLAFETVSRECRTEGKELADHLAHLIVHGVLHLLGYDHEVESEAERMEEMEIEILAALGLPNPYTENQASPA